MTDEPAKPTGDHNNPDSTEDLGPADARVEPVVTDSRPVSPQPVGKRTARKKKDHIVKLVFVAILIVMGTVAYMVQRRELSISGWGNSLTDALQQAQDTGRPILVFFVDEDPSLAAKTVADRIRKPKNHQIITEGKFVPVVVSLEGPDSPTAQQYSLRTLPTLMVLSPEGKELSRHEGEIGEVPLRQEFLVPALRHLAEGP
jgi:hypothetical protein